MSLPLSDAPQPLGAITGLHGDVLQGWALDPDNPDLRLAVEIYLDHAFVALVRADRQQSLEAPGDGFHGFAVQLRPNWLANARHIAARIANQGPWLEGGIALPAPASQQAVPIATQVYYQGGLKLKGWAWDPAAPTRHVALQVREGERLLLTGTADQPHPSLVNRPTSDHGFDLDLPWELADGQPHELHIETDRGVPLSGSPIRLCLHPEGLSALLLRHWPRCEPASDTPLPLLARLTKAHEERFPSSAGFKHYPEWHALFQQPRPFESTPGNVLVLLLGEGSAQDEAASHASLLQQRLPATQIRTIAPAATGLLEALAQHAPDARLVVPLWRGDRLAAHALDTLLARQAESAAAWVYADCDQDSPEGARSNPWLKPAWDETLFYGADIVSPGSAFAGDTLLRAIAHLQQTGQAAQADWHRLLASVVAIQAAPITHIPQVLYHRHAGAPVSPHQSLPNAQRQAALHWLIQQRAPGASIEPVEGFPALNRVRWPLPAQLPHISLIVPTRDQLELLRACIEGLLEGTDYPALEIIVVDNDSREPATLAYLDDIARRSVRVLRYRHPFNYAAINNWAVEQALGSIVGLINNDIDVLEPGWLKEMLGQLLRPGVGAVGAKLLWSNGMVQHGGVVVGVNGLAAHAGNHLNKDDPGYLGLNQLAREQSAVTAACLLVRKHDYQRLGGLDERRFPVTFNDVDFCLRLGEAGKRLVWTPFARLIHAESASRGKEDTPSKSARAAREQKNFIERWGNLGQGDTYYHPCLSADYLTGPYGGLAMPPRQSTPRTVLQIETIFK
ncbi:glycosyltransferase family 2 protein [Azotobacter beijerinckii]|uniref:Glycosyltransferase, GT2 family n=1 Tax=Azotobacter beijerinckii TaxID=170623 RepID=A0A1I4C8V7_9GAMM|nr:glycosyltransferase family 2 protein [Azotobacter beijerinckii]MDV7209641.1 glycosyltransferase family 2 protein [Azotobacter beijerinckii]SFB18050.1 Glycosyltransferase, GT2 family [Azotobacter beijerinckii]SFK77365.1 Glycosyltransferase, GT2 family [Azotobacter beijerinckii]